MISWADSSCLTCFISFHSLRPLKPSTFFFSHSSPVSMRCWGMSDRHGNPVPGQFSSWEEEEGGDHRGYQGLVSAQWHQRESGGLQHHLKRYAPPLKCTLGHFGLRKSEFWSSQPVLESWGRLVTWTWSWIWCNQETDEGKNHNRAKVFFPWGTFKKKRK